MSTAPAFKVGDKIRFTDTYEVEQVDTYDDTVFVRFGDGWGAWVPMDRVEIVPPTLTESYQALAPGTRFTFGGEVEYTKIDDTWLVMHYSQEEQRPSLRNWSDYSQATSATIEVVS